MKQAATTRHDVPPRELGGLFGAREPSRRMNADHSEEARETQLVGMFFETDNRSSVELPEGVREKAETLRESGRDGQVPPAARAHGTAEESGRRSE